MKQIFIDLVGVFGVGFLVYGVYLSCGESYALMLLGMLLIVWAGIKSKVSS